MVAGMMRRRRVGKRVATALLLLMALVLTGCPEGDGSMQQEVTIGGERFVLELALDDATRYQGLSDRPAIAPAGGMLFVFPQPQELCFVMRRCLTPIDLVFIGPSGRIVALHEMQVEPYDTPEDDLKKYCSGWAAQFAVELQAGTIRRLKLEPGQSVQMPLERLKQRAR
jgi:uncharacterized membrane protein (UPF0127 family)